MRRSRLSSAARRTLVVACVSTGLAVAWVVTGHPQLALFAATIAAAAALSVLRHLLDLKETR